MKITLENIKKVLSENRVDDVKKKFPNVDTNIINFFIENDPSGNQKYLDWLVKAMTHEPTVQSIEDILDENMQFNSPAPSPLVKSRRRAAFLITLVKKFHELLPYMVYKDEVSGEKYGTTDLYQYKFTDSDMINYLGNDLAEAKERKEKKEKEKDAKKNSDKIYEDGNWLVVRPKTWQASCVYGAGTKWCTTSKETDSHFKRETDRNFLIYVINKNKSSNDPEYKVAWQIPYIKKVENYLTQDGEFNESRIKLWNAEDTNIANRGSSGQDYLEIVSPSVKRAIVNYMGVQMEEMYKGMAYVDDPHLQALVEHLGLSEDDLDNIELSPYRHYDMRIYINTESGYAYNVATEEELDRAKLQWADNYIDDMGVWEAIGDDPERYIYINDIRGIASDMTNSYIGDLSDEEVIDEATRLFKRFPSQFNQKVNSLEEYNINKSIFETNQEEIDEMWKKYDDLTEEEEQELKELEVENEEIEKTNEKLLKSIRDAIYDDYYEDYVDRLSRNPLDWLEEFGYYSKKTGLDKDAISRGMVGVDTETLVTDLAEGLDVEYFSRTGSYNEVTIEGDRYYIIPTDY